MTLGTFGTGAKANVANAGESAEWLAISAGFYQKQDINMTIDGLQSSAVILQALESGSITSLTSKLQRRSRRPPSVRRTSPR